VGSSSDSDRVEPLGRGGFARVAYRLGRSRATGVLTVEPERGAREILVIRRGHLMAGGDARFGRREAIRRLERLAAAPDACAHFEGGVVAYPPGAVERQLALAVWARRHIEGQVDAGRARHLVRELAGVRLVCRPDLAPDPAHCDETDRRILAAMARPRRLDQIWPLARTPRFRMLAFVHFLRVVGAVELVGVAAPSPEPGRPGSGRAHDLLGISSSADRDAVKRAYRRLARALHPDMNQGASEHRRRILAERFALVSAAYRELVG
jgi:hypothetical protein